MKNRTQDFDFRPQEAHKMVHDANLKHNTAEKLLVEARMKIDGKTDMEQQSEPNISTLKHLSD